MLAFGAKCWPLEPSAGLCSYSLPLQLIHGLFYDHCSLELHNIMIITGARLHFVLYQYWKLFWAKILLNLGLLNNMVTKNQFYSVMTLFDVIKSLKILNLGKICAHPWYTNFIFLSLIGALLGTGTKVFFMIFSYWHWFGFL